MRLPCEPPLYTSCILSNWLLARFDLLRRRWLLPPFVRINLPPAVTRKRLAVALWVFSLYFLATMVIPVINLASSQLAALTVVRAAPVSLAFQPFRPKAQASWSSCCLREWESARRSTRLSCLEKSVPAANSRVRYAGFGVPESGC